jgi:uncharacterized protein (DUF1330 family)
MTKGYVLLTETIHDAAGMQAYGEAAWPTIVNAGATVLAADQAPAVLEGEWPVTQTVLLEFESVDAARAWYLSADYQAAANLRHKAAASNVVILAGT